MPILSPPKQKHCLLGVRAANELFATADVPYEGDRIETEFGIESAEEKLQAAGFAVSGYES